MAKSIKITFLITKTKMEAIRVNMYYVITNKYKIYKIKITK